MRCAECGSSRSGRAGRIELRPRGHGDAGAEQAGRSNDAGITPLRANLLAAREAREARIRRLAERARGGSLVAVTLSLPGAEKNPAGAAGAVRLAAELLAERLAAEEIFRCRLSTLEPEAPDATGGPADSVGSAGSAGSVGSDGSADPGGLADSDRALGPFAALVAASPPERVKAICISLEESLPWGRILDLDVYLDRGAAGLRQVTRGTLGLPGRRCFLCAEPARECVLLRRHSLGELTGRAGLLLREADRSRRVRHLAAALVRGARAELDLTPKPGLVDRRDNGSHPDLTYGAMRRSIDLLPAYYAELIRVLEAASCGRREPAGFCPLGEKALVRCVEAGRAAERRMISAIGANAHRGYVFLSGLVLLAAWEAGSVEPSRLRPSVAAIARRFFARERPRRSGETDWGEVGGVEVACRPGERLRRESGVGGIEAEARAGLPAVFERALPCLRPPVPGWDESGTVRAGPERSPHVRGPWRALAELMCVLEDTTALHRGGRAGLERVRRDGRLLRDRLVRGEDPTPALRRWNEEYRAARLTMGGVADCLALAIALAEVERRGH